MVRDIAGVGQNLRDHPKVYVTWEINPAYSVEARPARGGACLRYTAPGSNWRNDLSINMGAFVTARVPWAEAASRSQDDASATQRHIEMMLALLLPVSPANSGYSPLIRRSSPAWTIIPADAFDRQRLRAGVRLALRLAEHDDLKEIIGPLREPAAADLASETALDAWLLRQATTYSHISGTCKMGPGTDPMAVVDQYGMVHDLEGLRIVDASIMPNLVRAPINPTVVMMGERMAALMRQGR